MVNGACGSLSHLPSAEKALAEETALRARSHSNSLLDGAFQGFIAGVQWGSNNVGRE